MGFRAAVNAKCKDCIYDPCDTGTWRQQTDACTSTECGLWPVRPRSKAPVQDGASLAPNPTVESE